MVAFFGRLGQSSRKGCRCSKGHWDRFGRVGAWELEGDGGGVSSGGSWRLIGHVNGVGRHGVIGEEDDDREETAVAFIASRGCLRWYLETRSEACI